MLINGKKFVVLYLTDWQIKLIEDFLGVTCHRWAVPLEPKGGVRYAVGVPDDPKAKRLYFTDWQKREIKDEAGECCDYVELKEGMITDYGAVPET